MINADKVLKMIHDEGLSQRQVAKKLRVSQQAISKIWRAAHQLRKSKRGGDRRSEKYQKRVDRVCAPTNNNERERR